LLRKAIEYLARQRAGAPARYGETLRPLHWRGSAQSLTKYGTGVGYGGIIMQIKYNKQLISLAKQLRKDMTKEERRLWYDFLSGYFVRFTRQKVLGKYIADFYCAQAKLVIELDGSQHYEDIGIQKDAERTAFLQGYGLTVIRIPNNEVNKNFSGVCEYIDTMVKQSLNQHR